MGRPRRWHWWLGFVVGAGLGSGAGAAAQAQEPDPAAPEAWRTEQRDIRIPMRDGKWVAADLYLPPTRGQYPTVLIQTPYNKRGLGSPMAGRGRSDGLFDRANYAYVVVDWRGFFGSRAAKTGPRAKRGADGYDCVEWAAAQPWSDGKVGTWGPSALGKVQFDTAMEQPPHLVCCIPVIAAMGQQESFYFQDGVLRESHVQSLDRLGFGVGKGVKQSRGRPLLWRMAKQRTYKPERCTVPMLLITGWWDHFPDEILQTFADLKARGGPATRAHSKLLVGPWDHMSIGQAKQGDWRFPTAAPENQRSVQQFFDYWLRDQTDNGWADVATVRYWRINEEGWVEGDAWPAGPTAHLTWHLHPDGVIRPEPAATDRTPVELRIDPADLPPTLGGANLPPLRHGPVDQAPLAEREDVLVFDSAPLDAPLQIQGAVRVVVRAGLPGQGFDLAVRLCVQLADGRSQLLCDGIARVAKLGPDEGPTAVQVRLPTTAASVPVGAKLRILLAGGNRPRFEANPEVTEAITVPIAAQGMRVEIPVVEQN